MLTALLSDLKVSVKQNADAYQIAQDIFILPKMKTLLDMNLVR